MSISTFSSLLAEAVARKGLTYVQLAKELQVSSRCLREWLSGTRLPQPFRVDRLVQVLDLGAEALSAYNQALEERSFSPLSEPPQAPTNALATLIRRRMSELGISATELRDHIGVDKTSFYAVQRHPSSLRPPLAAALAEGLGVPVTEILDAAEVTLPHEQRARSIEVARWGRGLSVDALARLADVSPSGYHSVLDGTAGVVTTGKVARCLDVELVSTQPQLTMTDLSKFLTEARLRTGKPLAEIAEGCGVSRQCIDSWLRGATRPSASRLGGLADALECDYEDLRAVHASDTGLRHNRPATAQALTDARKQAGLLQRDLATALGVSQVTVAKWERGELPPARRHHAQLQDLIGWSPTV